MTAAAAAAAAAMPLRLLWRMLYETRPASRSLQWSCNLLLLHKCCCCCCCCCCADWPSTPVLILATQAYSRGCCIRAKLPTAPTLAEERVKSSAPLLCRRYRARCRLASSTSRQANPLPVGRSSHQGCNNCPR